MSDLQRWRRAMYSSGYHHGNAGLFLTSVWSVDYLKGWEAGVKRRRKAKAEQ